MRTFATTPELDLEWIKEEETLQGMNELPQSTVLPKIQIQFFVVDTESEVRTGIKLVQPLQLDLSNNVSILPKNTLLRHIESAKREYMKTQQPSATATSAQFSLLDILIWNPTIEPDHLARYASVYDPEWIASEFIRGNIFEDIILPPSLFVFHSEQTIYVILREKTPPPPNPTAIRGILRNHTNNTNTPVSASNPKKHATKRVQFIGNIPSKRATRKSK